MLIDETAIFYSISTHKLAPSGINFGNFLIKRVVDSLRTGYGASEHSPHCLPYRGLCHIAAELEKDFNFLAREQEKTYF